MPTTRISTYLPFIICIFLLAVTPITFAAESYPFAKKWQPLFSQCKNKFLQSEAVIVLKTIDRTRLSTDEIKQLDSNLDYMSRYSDIVCSCICNRSENVLVDVSDFEIKLLAQFFRSEARYPNKQVREAFGLAATQCTNLAIK